MKKIKIGIWLIIIAFLGLVIYQNRDFFFVKKSLGMDLSFAAYRSPELPVAVYFAAFFLFGWLIAYLFSLAERFRSGKQIRKLQQTRDAQQHAIDDMKKDVAALKPQPYSDPMSSDPVAEGAPASESSPVPQPEAAEGQVDTKQPLSTD